MNKKTLIISRNSNREEGGNCEVAKSKELYFIEPKKYAKVEFTYFDADVFIFANKCRYFGIPSVFDRLKLDSIESRLLYGVFLNDRKLFLKSLSPYIFNRIFFISSLLR